ncbi:MAG TPA: TlpA disulfide reductase family protein [Kofleriaceae bacterium]|nr:TlpA disulfide reductase family protein [Kofleriaceae bacterium]
MKRCIAGSPALAAAWSIAASLALGCGGADRAPNAGGDGGGGKSVRMRMTAMDGGEIDLVRYRGRAVVLHFFDTDSAAAQLDAEQLSALARREPERVAVVGICLDPEGYPMAAAWRRALGVRYLIALADQALRDGRTPLGKVRVVPTTVLLDRSGQVAGRIERPLQPGEIDPLVGDLLE